MDRVIHHGYKRGCFTGYLNVLEGLSEIACFKVQHAAEVPLGDSGIGLSYKSTDLNIFEFPFLISEFFFFYPISVS